MQDVVADDKVEPGEGHDTVYFDQKPEPVLPGECGEKNPIQAPNRKLRLPGRDVPGFLIEPTSGKGPIRLDAADQC